MPSRKSSARIEHVVHTSQPIKAHSVIQRSPTDKYVIWIVLTLSAIGVLAVYSSVGFLANVAADGDTGRFLERHLMRLGLAMGAVVLFSFLDYHMVARMARVFLLGAIVLLVLVHLFGVSYGGATRTLRLGSISLQASDVGKVALLLYVGVLLARKQAYIKSFARATAPIFLSALAVIILIGLEDLSTSALVMVVTCVMCFVGRVRPLHLLGLGTVTLLCALLLLLASPARAARLEAYTGVRLFSHTEETEVFSEDAGRYQIQQARIALAMGGLAGRGPGRSVQRDFLPVPYNDFIFAIVGEEYGLIGAMVVLLLFVGLLLRGYLCIACRAPDPLGLFLAVGLTTMFVLYGMVHAAVSTGLLPVTGLPMPMVSYGGTSMLANGVMVGILLNIARQRLPVESAGT